MTVFAWILVALWGLVLLASARVTLRGLPPPTDEVPPYALWLPEGGEAPTLEPAPAQVIVGALPPEGANRLLVLGPGVTVTPDLPRRLAACGDFVSVLPRPRGGLIGLAIERLRRDFAGVPAVLDATRPQGFADERCAWLRRRDLALPGVGDEPVLRAARARKAHGLTVDLRDGFIDDGPATAVRAPAMRLGAHRSRLSDLVAPEPTARWALFGVPLLLCLAPWPLLLDAASRPAELLAIGLGSAARLMTATREGFGYALTLAGWVIEPLIALRCLRARIKIGRAHVERV
ncbi:MAG: hypothetical protein KC620_19280, partial [Myxococcales bacterium]|nr:hypothetical protein [Myxococcales bacterium]